MSAYAEGNPGAKIALVGESPTSTELRLQRPFVGPAGHKLDEVLHGAGLVRRECYITNLFEYQVKKSPDGKRMFSPRQELLWNDTKGFTEEGYAQINKCYDRLNACDANVIVPLGNTALDALFSQRAIMKWRGSILRSCNSRMDRVRKLVPTVHPAAIVRGNYLWRYLAIADLTRAREESSSPNYDSLPEREYVIDPSYTDCISFLKKMLSDHKLTATDIECLNHQVSCFSLSNDPSLAISIPLVDRNGEHRWTVQQEAEIWRLYAEIMSDPTLDKVNQNISFDVSFLLSQNNIITRGKLHDTMVAQHILYPDFPKGLDFICTAHTREPYYKDDGKLWQKPWADSETFWLYSAKDSAVALEAWYALKAEMDESGYTALHDRTCELIYPLVYMMIRGVQTDKEALASTKGEVQAQIDEKTRELNEVADFEFNPGSPKQCQDYFYRHKGIKPYISRKTGRPTTDDTAMSRIIRKHGLKEARLVQELRGLNKLMGTYLEVQFDRDNRLRCSYNIRGTKFGRLSSSQTIFGTGTNMQNLPSRFKGFLVADYE